MTAHRLVWEVDMCDGGRMADMRIVAKAMDDLADDWHWVLLVGATELEPRVVHAERVRTACGLTISAVPRVVRLFDMGAPDTPTCPRCLERELDPGLRAAISEAIEEAERIPAAV
jgi:hypothetical protein